MACVVACFVGGCGDSGPDFEYPRDAELRFNHLQGIGTHNSYHVEPENADVDEWKYSHTPLDEQLATGIRQFEIDLNVNVFDERFEVYHIIRIDDVTTCALFVDCLRDLKRWSDANPAHHPFVVMLEPKDGFDADFADTYVAWFEEELASVWPEDRLITPDFVRGDYPTLADALADRGWPTLGEVRGRGLFFLLDSDEYRAHYTHGDSSLDGRLAFVTADAGSPFAAVASKNDPSDPGIADALAANLIVRTRIDEVGPDGPMVDADRLAAALASGAHFLSTDVESTTVPGGSPSRCNPVTAPADRQSADIENPAFID